MEDSVCLIAHEETARTSKLPLVCRIQNPLSIRLNSNFLIKQWQMADFTPVRN